jgi:hypothetical protein
MTTALFIDTLMQKAHPSWILGNPTAKKTHTSIHRQALLPRLQPGHRSDQERWH